MVYYTDIRIYLPVFICINIMELSHFCTVKRVMGITASSLETIVNESYYDGELASLFHLSYQTLASEDSLAATCVNLPAARLPLVQSFYQRILNGIISPDQFTALYPLVSSSLSSRQQSGTTAQLVQLALEIELGIRNAAGNLVNGSATPTQTAYGCVGLVLKTVNLNTGALKYKLRTEYEPTLDPSQGAFLDQSSMIFAFSSGLESLINYLLQLSS